MNTEKAYRDLGEAIVNAYLDWSGFLSETKIIVHAKRIRMDSFKVSFFINGNNHPVVEWGFDELEKVSNVHKHIIMRKEAGQHDR